METFVTEQKVEVNVFLSVIEFKKSIDGIGCNIQYSFLLKV